MKIEEFFGTLQESMLMTWRSHLKTNKYSEHIALDEYYSEIVDLVDTLVENWMGSHMKLEEYTNILDGEEYDAIQYLESLRQIVVEGRELMDSSELESNVDDILGLIDRTLYKLKNLTESKLTSMKTYIAVKNIKNLGEYISENIDESKNDGKDIAADMIRVFFGYEPKKLSDENMKCNSDEDINKLIEDIEMMYAHQEDSIDPYDDTDREEIHNALVNWIKNHNK